MITEQQYQEAIAAKEQAEKTMQTYHKERSDSADARFDEFEKGDHYKDGELRYSAFNLCPCGHGLAYPKECGSKARYWDCSAIWKGEANPQVEHTGKLPFSFYDVKSEDQIHPRCEKKENGENKTYAELGVTTRGVFRPKEGKE